MKLIDILVRELPKRGGWPAVAIFAMQDSDGLVKFSRSGEKIYHDHSDGHEWCSEGGYDWIRVGVPFEGNFRTQVSQDNATAFISREQYEAALAGSKPEWDGEGLPPVGTRCEFISNDISWGEVDVIGIDGDKVVFKPSGETYYGIAPSQRQIFRPIRTEADKKKEEVEKAIADALFKDGDFDYAEALRLSTFVYGAISRSEIPHIRID